MKLVLIRGIPGSGKSTLAREKYVPLGFEHFETDKYFYEEGEYRFNPSLLHRYHCLCRDDAEFMLWAKKNVVVSNTFTTLSELVPYVKMGIKYGAEIEIITCDGEYGSIHNVPEETIERMKNRFWRGDLTDIINHIEKHHANS